MRALGTILAVTASAILGLAQGAPVAAHPGGTWSLGGHDRANTRWNPAERILTTDTVAKLSPRWTQTTTGDVSATPAVVRGAVYFPDWGGGFTKLDARTGALIWRRSIPDYVGIPTAVSRTSPAVVGRTVYIGTQRGARLLAIDTVTGNLRWSTTMDAHPSAILTQSPMVHGGVIYQGVSSDEEIAAIDPGYDCCTFRGSVAAIDAGTGEILWRTYLSPATEDGSAGRYSGTSVWSGTPVIDPATRTVYVTSGNNYTVPESVSECQENGGTPSECSPDNHLNSIVALDAASGAIKWSSGQDAFDTWNGGCIVGPPPNNCPPIEGPDHDFADGAHLVTVRGPNGRPRKLVGAGQKSGSYWMVDATTGEIVWSAAAGPGSFVGGIQWGTATDGKQVYLVETNFLRLPHELPDGQVIDYSSIAALDVATGEVVWQIPEPHQGLAMGAVSVAGDVLYAGSLSGFMYAIDTATGEVLWETRGEGASNAGPAVVDGTVFWGNGYDRAGLGTPSRTFYAFGLPRGK
jgi:polyvinyl alcohol dehydrogenase (cytochrome)